MVAQEVTGHSGGVAAATVTETVFIEGLKREKAYCRVTQNKLNV